MKTLFISAVFFLAALGGVAESGPEQNIFESSVCTTPESPIDKFVYRKLSKLGMRPSICSDAVFVRRAFLDVIGTLPTAKHVKEFIQDPDPDKRSVLVDRLLEREEFADYWAMKWSDLLRVKAEFPINLWPNAAQAYHHWIRASIRDNKPYDQFVREMLTANGSNFRVGQVNFYRAMQNKTPEGIATTVALTFMGARAESWPKNYLPGMAVFFSQISYKPTREWKEEIVFWDPNKEDLARINNNVTKQAANAVAQVVVAKPVRSVPQVAIFPDGTKIKKLPPNRDPREVFADWLITPKNAWFTANIVNRIWSWLLGRGIIHEPDDIRPDNPPSNPALLAYLQKEFVANKYDIKHVYRLILTSRTYQLSSINPKPDDSRGEANFAFYPLRQLDAEVLIDAINKVTGTTDPYTSAIPEPFTFIPDNKPAIALPDGSITSPFLDLFGRPARATGMENERVNRPSPTQRMHMLNSSHIQRKLQESPKLKAIMGAHRKRQEIMENLYLTILSRFPTDDEVKNAEAYAKSGVVKGREAWIDLVWALINSDEFIYRH
ncbi:MAG: DUF1553 domain-containing protein [Verrucomicrobiota bacterium]